MVVWRDIAGFEGRYQVSNTGRVRNVARGYRLLKGSTNDKGYRSVSLTYTTNKKCTKSVHRLVAIAFIPNTDNKPDVNHKNSIKVDNHVKNLEWCTKSENQLHSYTNPSRPRWGLYLPEYEDFYDTTLEDIIHLL